MKPQTVGVLTLLTAGWPDLSVKKSPNVARPSFCQN
jgi:hypothetical protein